MEAVMNCAVIKCTIISGSLILNSAVLGAGGGARLLDSGTEEAFLALPDYVSDPSLTVTGACSVTFSLTDNDGIVVKDAAGVNDILLTCQNAESIGLAREWLDIGPYTNSEAALYFEHGALAQSVESIYPGIQRALICNGGELSELYYQGMTSAGKILPDNADTKSASIEFWVRPDASVFNTQISTLYETGGGVGSGIVIDHGVLKAAVGSKMAQVEYDLNADTFDVLPQDPTNEFFQIVFVMDLDNDKNQLYVNGTLVDDTTGNTVGDWDGGDSAGVGRFQGANHGGFISPAAGTAYDTYYSGAIAAIRFYGEALDSSRIQRNFETVTVPSSVAPSALGVAGIYNSSGTLITGLGTPITLASGGVVTLDSVNGSFTYDPSGLEGVSNLWSGCVVTDTFACQITNSAHSSDAAVTLEIQGVSRSGIASVNAREGDISTFTAGQLQAADQLDHGDLNPFIAYYAHPDLVAEPYNNPTTWHNAGSGGNYFDATTDTVELRPVISGFGGIPYAVTQPMAGATAPSFLSSGDMSIEIWFKPDFKATGQQVLFEFGGSGQGSMLVYNAEKNAVEVYVDGGSDLDSDLQLYAVLSGLSFNEFNQVIALFDIQNEGAPDTVTLYLNNTPEAPFSTGKNATASNPAGAIKLLSGTDKAGIGSLAGATMAFGKELPAFTGQMSHMRIYSGVLDTDQMAQAYESIRRPLTAVTQTTSPLGATVTLNADLTIGYDAGSLTTNIPVGTVATDYITYQFKDSGGTTIERTTPVLISGAGTAIARDDFISISQDTGATNFNPILNDTCGAGAQILNSAVGVASYRAGFTSGTYLGEIADFRDENGYGWAYMWNAPTGWVDNLPYDGTSGKITDTNAYQFLLWNDGNGRWAVNSDNISSTGEPGGWVQLHASGGHPGSGPEDPAQTTVQRRPITAYTVSEAGYYGISNGWVKKGSELQNPIHVVVLVNDEIKFSKIGPNATSIDFNCELGYLEAGDTIYVGFGAYLSRGNDGFNFDYSIVKLPGAGAQVPDSIGTLTTDGTTLTFNPGTGYRTLAAGESIFETLTYTVLDDGELTTATVTIEIKGVNDAPAGVHDTLTISEDDTLAAVNVLANDTDPDKGDPLNFTVTSIQNSNVSVGTTFLSELSASVTLDVDGNFSYNTTAVTNLLNTLSHSNIVYESFSYRMQDELGLEAPALATVTVRIIGDNDPVRAVSNNYTILRGQNIQGNLILDDTGNGTDYDPDSSDLLSITATETAGVGGDLQFEQRQISRVIGFRGKTTINGSSRSVTYDPIGGQLANPVVFTAPASYNDDEPGEVMIGAVDPLAGTFKVRFKEQPEGGAASDGDGDTHADETISWMVFDAGAYTLPDGTRLEVGSVTTNHYRQMTGGSTWATVAFHTAFTNQPVLIHRLQRLNDPFNEIYTTRVNSTSPHTYAASAVSSNEFSVAIQCFEGDANDSTPVSGTIGWLAIEVGSGTWNGSAYQADVSANSFNEDGVVNNFSVDFGDAPDIIASMVTYAGADPSALRCDWISGTQYKFISDEDTVSDIEQSHADELASFLAIGGSASEIRAFDSTPPEGSFTYDSSTLSGVSGTIVEIFTYTVSDNQDSFDTGTVTITVVPPSGSLLIVR